jgi:hypothetical protein
MLSKYQFISSGKTKEIKELIKDNNEIYLKGTKLKVNNRNNFGSVDRDAIKESLASSLLDFKINLEKQEKELSIKIKHLLVSAQTFEYLTRNSDFVSTTIVTDKKNKRIMKHIMMGFNVKIDVLDMFEIVPVFEKIVDKTFKKRFINEL